jgi:chemotaxis protein MotB
MIADFKEESQTTIDELKEEINAKTDQISALEEKLKTNLVDKIIFESASAKVTKEGGKILFRIAPILEEAKDKEIHIVGHCDRLPPGAELSKKYRTNWKLSTARATAIAQILQWGYGIDAGRIVAVGVAHYRPIYTGSEKKISEKNRAIEIFLTTPKKAEE